MSDLIADVAVIGRVQLMPGILPVRFTDPDVECLVAHNFANELLDPSRDIKVDTSDCTVFKITHLGQGNVELTPERVHEIFERSVRAIGEVAIWTKAKDVSGKITPYLRQIGTLDVKAFFVASGPEEVIGWFNPAFTFDRNSAALMANFMSGMLISNGPSATPVHPIARRVMSSLDLINLGFYTESFVNLFSLVDDLTQEVTKAGLDRKGLNGDEKNGLLRAIKEERLKVYLCNLAKLCDWQSLEDGNRALYGRVLKVNQLRNKIMHGSLRLTRSESIDSSNVLLALIDWLRANPFGYQIPVFPPLNLAEPQFALIPLAQPPEDASVRPGTDGTAAQA